MVISNTLMDKVCEIDMIWCFHECKVVTRSKHYNALIHGIHHILCELQGLGGPRG